MLKQFNENQSGCVWLCFHQIAFALFLYLSLSLFSFDSLCITNSILQCSFL